MKRIEGHKLREWSLRFEAIYGPLLSATVACWAAPIATVAALSHPLILAAGVTVALWASLVRWMLMRLRIQRTRDCCTDR